MPEMCKESCPQLDKLELEVRALREQGRETHKEIFDRLNAIEKTNAVQDERYKSTMEKLEEISKNQKTISAQLAALESKPGKRWETLVSQIISSIISVAVGLIIGRWGL